MPLVFPVPPLSTAFAHLLSITFAFVYVGSIYLSKNSRLSFSRKTVYTNGQARPKERDERWRDDPDVIKARLAAVGFATLICCVSVIGVVGYFVGDIENVSSFAGAGCIPRSDKQFQAMSVTLESARTRLGVTLDGLSPYPYLVTPMLFLGPLYARYLSEALPGQSQWSLKYDLIPTLWSWQGVRNYVFVRRLMISQLYPY